MALVRILLCAVVVITTVAIHVCCDCELNVTGNSVVENYESNLVLSNKYKNVVLVLGLSGNGMTTVTQWFAGDASKLKSKAVSGDYIVIDDDKIGTSPINSKTIYPELVIDKDTDTAYYDIPGFDSSKGAEYDIATLYFIKRILEHVDSIKVLLVVSYSTVIRDDRGRQFIKVLKHFTDLVKDNVDKFNSGVGLVVNKVTNRFKNNSDGTLSFIEDDKRKMRSVVDNLQQMVDELTKFVASNTSSGDIVFDNKDFCRNAIKIINSLLGSEGQSDRKISLFRRPHQEGLLKDMPNLEREKLRLRNMVSNNLKFISKQNDDFCYKTFKW